MNQIMNSKGVVIGLVVAVPVLLISTVLGFVLYAKANSNFKKADKQANRLLMKLVEDSYEFKIVEIIKDMKWKGSKKTIGAGAKSFMDNPKFEGALSDKNMLFVTLSGGIRYRDKPAKVEMQFHFKPEVGYVEIDGERMSRLMGVMLIEKMCQE